MDSIEQAISSSLEGLSGREDSSSETVGTAEVVDTDSGVESAPEAADVVEGGEPEAVEGAAPVAEPAVAAEAPAMKEETLETLQQELAGKRDNRIPYSRVQKIVENAKTKARAEVEAEVQSKYAQYETPDFQNGLTAMRVAEESPEQFLAALAGADERYARLLAGAAALGGVAAAQPAAKPAAAAAGGEIAPNIQLSDGTLGYDAQATQALLERQEAALTAAFERKLEERLAGLKPIEQDYRTAALRREAATKVQAQVAAAEKWVGFGDHKDAIAQRIMEATKRGETLSLQDAYIQVVIPKLQAASVPDEAAIRRKIAEEQKRLQKGASGVAASAAAPATAATAVPEGVDPVEHAIQQSIRGLKR